MRAFSVFYSTQVVISIILTSCLSIDKPDLNNKTKEGKTIEGKSVRNTVVLSDNWRFQLDIGDIGEKENWFKDGFDRGNWAKVTVPQAWDCYEKALWGYEGIGWYSMAINPNDFNTNNRTEIIFGRIMYYSKIWINGEYIGENTGGYLPFNFNITNYLKPGQENNLVVRVDNKPRIEWLPAGNQIEWVQYGGILEPVRLVGTSHTYIDDLTIRTEPENGGANINFMVDVVNETDIETQLELEIEIVRGIETVTKSVKLQSKPNDSNKLSVDVTMNKAELWSPETPNLYMVKTSLKKGNVVIDDFTDKMGIRKVSTNGTAILLNDEPITIKGVNRYDEYGQSGPNVSEKLLRKELALMKSVGINTIHVHYPQSPRLLSLYDEYGFMMVEEIPLNWWGQKWWGEQKISLDILDQAKPTLRKMIARDKNHPCIIVWSMANESGTDTEIGIAVMRELLKQAKSLDPTRLVTFVAAGDPRKHLGFDEADIVCFNMYNGVFGETSNHISEIDSIGFNPLVQQLTEFRKSFNNKPIFIAEFGVHGIKNIHGDVRFTEEFQAAYIDRIWQGITSVPGVSGGVLWCWADYYHRKHFINYAVFGPYGVVTVDRNPKKSLETLRRMYSAPTTLKE